jgi:hypothetical protein
MFFSIFPRSGFAAAPPSLINCSMFTHGNLESEQCGQQKPWPLELFLTPLFVFCIFLHSPLRRQSKNPGSKIRPDWGWRIDIYQFSRDLATHPGRPALGLIRIDTFSLMETRRSPVVVYVSLAVTGYKNSDRYSEESLPG